MKDSSPQHSAIGGPLPVLLHFRNGGRGWRMSLGALVQASLLGLVLLLPLLSIDPVSTPPVREWVSPPIWKGDPQGTVDATTTGGTRGEKAKDKPKPNLADIRLVFPEVSVDQPEVPAIGPGNGNGPDKGPARRGDRNGSEDGIPPLDNIVPPPPTRNLPEPSKPIRPGGDVRPPRLIHRVEPEYPRPAKLAGIQGDVVLEALLDKDGRVRNVEVKSGHPMLREAARDAVGQWVYEPTYLNGQPYAVLLTVTVEFRLRR